MDSSKEFKQIQEQSGKQPHDCSCNKCAAMCKRSPCLGTPADILRLIDAGHVDKIGLVHWAAGMLIGIPIIDMVQLDQLPNGSCIMFKDGLCTLHESGLKPTEGKLAQHEEEFQRIPTHQPLPVIVAKTWLLKDNIPAIERIVDHLIAHENAKKNEPAAAVMG